VTRRSLSVFWRARSMFSWTRCRSRCGSDRFPNTTDGSGPRVPCVSVVTLSRRDRERWTPGPVTTSIRYCESSRAVVDPCRFPARTGSPVADRLRRSVEFVPDDRVRPAVGTVTRFVFDRVTTPTALDVDLGPSLPAEDGSQSAEHARRGAGRPPVREQLFRVHVWLSPRARRTPPKAAVSDGSPPEIVPGSPLLPPAFRVVGHSVTPISGRAPPKRGVAFRPLEPVRIVRSRLTGSLHRSNGWLSRNELGAPPWRPPTERGRTDVLEGPPADRRSRRVERA